MKTSRLSRPIPMARRASNLGSQAYFLEEDFTNHVVPHLRSADAYRLKVDGVPSQVVHGSLSLGSTARGLEGFIRSVASLLLVDGEVWLEVTLHSNEESTTQFQVYVVNGVHQEPDGRITQDLPHRDELPDWYPEDDAWGQTVELNPELMVHISLPEEYPRGLIASVISELDKISVSPTPDWALRQVIGQYPGTPRFDHAEAYRIERLRILEVASPIGWTAREGLLSQSSRVMSYYYYLLRELRFLHFVASLREQAEAALIQVLEIAGERCDFSAKVIARGVITPSEVCNLIRRFASGSLPFALVRETTYQMGVYPPEERERVL